MSGEFPLVVLGAGRPSMWRGWRARTPSILLSGDETAHHGVTVGGPGCRLVADDSSPLRFSYVGDGVRYRKADHPDTQRWVVLIGESEGFDATVRELFGRNVRIEYAREVPRG